MMTTLLPSAPAESVLKAPARATTGASVPRHLAIALSAGAGTQSPSLHAAAAALRAIVEGCAERGVASLTLLRPAGDTEIFEAAMASIPSLGVAVNLASERDGRAELLGAVRELALRAQHGELSADAIDAGAIEDQLSTRGLPAVDLLIATVSDSVLRRSENVQPGSRLVNSAVRIDSRVRSWITGSRSTRSRCFMAFTEVLS